MNIKVTFLHWFIITLGGLAVIAMWIFVGQGSRDIYSLFIQFLSFVVTPCIYILNRETTKQIIALENWIEGLRTFFMSVEDTTIMAERVERRINQA